MTNMTLSYYVDVKASLDELRKTGIIKDQAIDSSVNKNGWHVPDEDLDYFASTLKDAQVRVNHFTTWSQPSCVRHSHILPNANLSNSHNILLLLDEG
jgi:hypothetical protein